MIDQRIFTARMVYFSLIASLGMYGLVLFQLHNPPQPLAPPILYGLMAVAAMVMVAIPILRGRMMPPTREPHSLDEKVADEALLAALPKLFPVWIVSWAMCESIAIFGFLLSFLSADPKYFWAFAAVSLINFAFYRPTREQVLSVARAAV